MFLNILASIRTNNFQDEHCIEKITLSKRAFAMNGKFRNVTRR